MKRDLSTTKDIAELLGKCRNRIHRVGVELEGGWDRLPAGVSDLHNDISVRFEGAVRPRHRGEIPSKPMPIMEFPSWVKQTYPQHVNDTCGMHVHMSFRSLVHYQALMCKEYPEAVLKFLAQWGKKISIPETHPFWIRITGRNRFCMNEFHADFQAAALTKDDNRRRTVINYCYGMHNTVECRVLPMFEDPDTSIEAIKELLSITNAFLVAHTRREEAQTINLDSVGDIIAEREEYHECV